MRRPAGRAAQRCGLRALQPGPPARAALQPTDAPYRCYATGPPPGGGHEKFKPNPAGEALTAKWTADSAALHQGGEYDRPLTPEEIARLPTPGMEGASDREPKPVIERDYSEEDVVMRKGIGAGASPIPDDLPPDELPGNKPVRRASTSRSSPEEDLDDITWREKDTPRERLENPWWELRQMDIMRHPRLSTEYEHFLADGQALYMEGGVKRLPSGKWITKSGYGLEDLKTYPKPQLGVPAGLIQQTEGKTVAPEAQPSKDTNVMIEQLYGKNVDEDFKTEVADFMKRKQDMQKWWQDKMKTSPSQLRSGQVLGLEVPPRDIVQDYRTMVNQFGHTPYPRTQEEWDKFDTWEWKKAYITGVPKEADWWLLFKRLFLFTFFVAYFGEEYTASYLGMRLATNQWKSMDIADLTVDPRYSDPYYVYRPRNGYPYT